MNARDDTRSMGDLSRQLAEDAAALVRGELTLAKTEMAAKARGLTRGAGIAGAGAVLALVAVGTLAAAAVAALSLVVPTWLAALIVAVVAAVVAGILVLVGVKMLRRAAPPVPTETVESVKEDVAWVKTQAKSGAK